MCARHSIQCVVCCILFIAALAGCGAEQPVRQSDEVAPSKVPVTTSSEAARASYLTGRELLEDLRFTDAHSHFEAAVTADPGFATAWVGVANTSPTTSEFFAALHRAVAASDGASEAERLQIKALEAAVNGRPTVQRDLLLQLVEAFPEDERVHNALGTFHFGRQEYEASIESYNRSIAINPEYAPPYNQLGYALRFVDDTAGAEEAFRRYTELIPDQPNPYDSYAELLMTMGRFDESMEMYGRALEIDRNFVPSYIGIANNQIFLDDPESARETLASLAEIARTDGERRQACTWSAVSYLHQGDLDNALIEVRRRQEIAEANDDWASVAADHNLRGNILLHAGRSGEAIEAFEAGIQAIRRSDATDDVKAATERNVVFDLARVAVSDGNLETAAELASTYAATADEHGIPFELRRSHHLNGMIALARGEAEHALDELGQANQLDPRVLILEARAYATAGDIEAARTTCRQVLDLNQLNLNLGFVRNTAREYLDSL